MGAPMCEATAVGLARTWLVPEHISMDLESSCSERQDGAKAVLCIRH